MSREFVLRTKLHVKPPHMTEQLASKIEQVISQDENLHRFHPTVNRLSEQSSLELEIRFENKGFGAAENTMNEFMQALAISLNSLEREESNDIQYGSKLLSFA